MPYDEEAAQARDELSRANQAKSILDNPLVREALDAIKTDAEKAWQRAASTDVTALQAAKMQHDTALSFVSKLEQHLRTGRLAEAKLEEISRRRPSPRR